MKHNKLRVAITHGDINGIGYEIILKLLSEPRMTEMFTPVVYGAAKIAGYYKKLLDHNQVQFNIITSANDIIADKNNFVNCIDEDIKVEVGIPSEISGRAALKALETAVSDLKSGIVDVLVTAPINKNTIQSDNFRFHGHTEYLQDRIGDGQTPLMILLNDKLKVALVTGHTPVSELHDQITSDKIITKLKVFNTSLIEDFGIVKPRIAVLALNPHAGDNGLIGKEEEEVIIPAIKKTNEENILCFGPYPADGFFGASSYNHFDGVLAMYHDQGLAPFKTISMDDGVNYTAGLPFIRTSPDHGTAYDIAGKNEASENSLRQAIYTAIDVYENRLRYKEMSANPLIKRYVDKSSKDETLNLMQDND